MALNHVLVENLIRIVSHGGGVQVSAKAILVDNLVLIAGAARASGATVTITDCEVLLVDSMVQIASHGGGRVIFT